MEKLHNKIFYLIYGLLTIVLVSVLFISSYRTYNIEYKEIDNILQHVGEKVRPNNDMPPAKPDGEEPLEFQDNRERIFVDATVYTVTLDSDMNPTNIKNNNASNESSITTEEVKELLTNKKGVNNLYISKYAYSINKEKNTMYIIDISSTNNKLRSDLIISIIILFISEIIIVILTKKITDWITKPVEESFNKQKEFITDASHELKTPLAVITSNIDMIEGKKEDKKWIDNIKNESDRMNKLIINLLDLAKLENDNNITLSTINLSKVLEKTILPFEGIMYEKNIKLTYNIDDNIEYLCNEEQIKELIVILIDNAIKHSKGKVIANLKKEKKNIILEITNNGDPIPKGEEEKIFERFYKVDKSRNRKDNNYGIGLAIAKSITEKNNGEIKAESNNGFTSFKITFKNK